MVVIRWEEEIVSCTSGSPARSGLDTTVYDFPKCPRRPASILPSSKVTRTGLLMYGSTSSCVIFAMSTEMSGLSFLPSTAASLAGSDLAPDLHSVVSQPKEKRSLHRGRLLLGDGFLG